ncbi:helix-turn-helix domain-containing protein [Enterococcus faecalis]|uniref:helix-turn-helix domain-containing protein n=1 Tax=Enterococcus faecalis TaxID=1351 RepID=UPI00404131E4
MNTKDRIKQLATQRTITIAELERNLDIANGTIGKWDKQNPSIEPLKKLADYFGVTTDYLLGRTNDPYISQKHEEFAEGIFPIFMDATNEELELFNKIMLLSNKEKHILRDLVDMLSELKKANSK